MFLFGFYDGTVKSFYLKGSEKMLTSSLTIRNYHSGDEQALVAMWNLAYACYGGYVSRSPEYWRWCILERPGVSPQDLIILQCEGDILGYGVLGPKGAVLELTLDLKLSSRKREKMATRLIMALEERSRIRGDEIMHFKLPYTDEPVCRALKHAGYREERGESFTVAIVDVFSLLAKILCHRESRIPKGWSPTFLLEISSGNYRFPVYQRLRINIESRMVEKVDRMGVTADYTVDTDLSTLTDIIFRRTTFDQALTTGGIIVHPTSGLWEVRTLVSLLTLESPWYTPHSDGR